MTIDIPERCHHSGPYLPQTALASASVALGLLRRYPVRGLRRVAGPTELSRRNTMRVVWSCGTMAFADILTDARPGQLLEVLELPVWLADETDG
jgi:hypothetical protein